MAESGATLGKHYKEYFQSLIETLKFESQVPLRMKIANFSFSFSIQKAVEDCASQGIGACVCFSSLCLVCTCLRKWSQHCSCVRSLVLENLGH